MQGSVFCFGAASRPELALSQQRAQRARRVHLEDAAPGAEMQVSHVDGAENQILDKTMAMTIL